MATARDIRVLALQALYALDASDGREPEAVRAAIDAPESLRDVDAAPVAGRAAPAPSPSPEYSAGDRRRAFELAHSAWTARAEADAFFADLAPTWPANRQPIIDRSILRLAWQELSVGKTPARVVVDEAIDLARQFSTEKSPAFINALLDKALKAFETSPGADDDADDGAVEAEGEGSLGPSSRAGDGPGALPPAR